MKTLKTVLTGVVSALLTGALLHAQPSLTAPSTDLFVRVAQPGWNNTSQYSVTGAWGDYDKDGFIDLFVANSIEGWEPRANFLYRNNRNGTFTPTTAAQVGAVVTNFDASVGGYWGDFNNDGRLDLFVLSTLASATSPAVMNRLYLNRENGGFTLAAGGDLTKPCYAVGWAAVADYDQDGWLDVYVPSAWTEAGRFTNQLYHARGDGRFTHVTDSPVVTDRISSVYTLSAVWGDYDNDGDVDLVVANNQGQDFFYRNDGRGQFTRLTNSLLEQPGYLTRHQAWGDYDNDGFLDLASGCRDSLRLFRNDGGSDFLVATNWTAEVDRATPVWGDYDNDGHLDLLAIRGQSVARQVRLFHNNGDGSFDQVEDAFTRPSGYWLGGGWGDYDNDGFLDLFIANDTGQNVLYHNEGNGNHWLTVQLEGKVSNGAAIGAKVRVKATIAGKTVWQLREVSGGNYCQNDLRPHFGLGDATVAEVVRIEWPSGNVQEYTEQPVDRLMRITEALRITPARPTASLGGTVRLRSVSATGTYQWRFNGVELPGETGTTLVLTNIQLAHQGRYSVVVGTGDGGTTTNFTYLTVDPQFSTVSEGPLVATRESGWSCNWWDFDRDGNLDLFVPNGAEASSNEASALFRGDGQGGFTRVSESEGGPLVSDRGRWTVAACGDYDNDGFDDVVVASWTAGQPIRLYRSRAGGGFEKVLNPASFGPGWGTPTWGDYDLDGWLDLYIGSGEYSVAATRPVLWHNEGGGVFVEVRNSPAVTSPFADTMAATWTDYDGDGDPDLFVTDHTLQQVALYRNSGHGDLTRTSAGSLTSDRFTALVPAFADYDNDGDLDVLVSGYTGSTRLYGNTGDGQFALQFSMSGTEAGRPAWGDYDNDGYLDFYLPQGQGGPVANQFWRNNGDGTFLPLTIGSPAGDVGYSPAASWGDYDNDGFLDLFVPGNKGEVDHLYHNNGNSNSWLMVNLLGTVSNRSAIGAKVRVWATLGGKRVWQMRELSGGNRAQDDPRAHFGLGTAPAADIVRIEWPSGIVQELRNVPAKQILTVTEPPALEALGEGRVRILCWARQSYEVEASDNLQTWHTLGVTDTDQSRPVVLDPGAAGKSHRFYRAKGL